MRVSPSEIGLYLRCPVAWHFRYRKGLILPPRGIQVAGRAFDEAANVYYALTLHGRPPKPSDVGEIYVHAFRRELPLAEDRREIDAQKIENNGYQGVKIWTKELASHTKPVEIQAHRERPFTPDKSIILHGYLDVVADGLWLDHKLGMRKPDTSTIQMAAYMLLERREPFIDFLDIRKGEPARIRVELDRPLSAWVRVMWQAIRAMRAGVIVPIAIGTWRCSPKWCGYWDICPYGGKKGG